VAVNGPSRDRLDPYTETSAIDRDCAACGARRGQKCTFLVETYRPGDGVRLERCSRRFPCVTRLKGNGGGGR